MQRYLSQRRSSGFTLIELLVVIAIIAILAAILFPVFAKAREKARQITCASNEKQLALAILQYVQDNNETMPTGNSAKDGGGGSITWGGEWPVQVYPYVKSTGAFHCPDEPQTGPSSDGVGTSVAQDDYAINKNMMDDHVPETCLSNISAYNAPASTVMLSESLGAWGAMVPGPGQDFTSWNEGNNGSGNYFADQNMWQNCDGGQPTTGLTLNYIVKNRTSADNGNCTPSTTGLHTGGSNYAFADGHVKWLLPQFVSGGGNAAAADCNTQSASSSPPGDAACNDSEAAAGTGVSLDTGHGGNGYSVQATFSVK